MSNSYRGSSIDAAYQISYHLAKWFQRKSCFRNRPIRNKNYLWWSCLLTDQNGMSNYHRGPSIDASYHVSVHLAKLFQKSTNQKQELPVVASLLMNRDKMSNLYREPSMDASYQVSVHLAKRFQRTRFLEIDQLKTRIAYGSHIC